MNRSERRELVSLAQKTIGHKVEDIEFPGGKRRDSVRLIVAGGKRVIATRRPTSRRAEQEVRVLRALHQHGANVPKIYGFRDGLLLQQDLGRARLSESLHDPARKDDIPGLLDAALTSMAGVHQAGAMAGLADEVPLIGGEDAWCHGLAGTPHEVAEMTGIPAPDYDREAVARLLAVRAPSFVKWDSRPGNALVSKSDKVYWFDWEHCGARNAADDFVWLLADEFVTFSRSMEARLIKDHLSGFAGTMMDSEAEHYVRTLGCFHACVRLELILQNKGKGKWWSLQRCLEGDKVGVARRCARRILRRSAHWADHDALTRPLVPWFRDLEGYIESL